MGGAGEGWGHLGDVLQRLVEQLHLRAQRLHLFCRWLLSTRGLLRNTTWLACNVHRALGVQSARRASCLAPPAHITPRTLVLHTASWLGAAPCTPTRILVSYTPCPSVHGVLVCTVRSTKLPPCPGGCALGSRLSTRCTPAGRTPIPTHQKRLPSTHHLLQLQRQRRHRPLLLPTFLPQPLQGRRQLRQPGRGDAQHPSVGAQLLPGTPYTRRPPRGTPTCPRARFSPARRRAPWPPAAPPAAPAAAPAAPARRPPGPRPAAGGLPAARRRRGRHGRHGTPPGSAPPGPCARGWMGMRGAPHHDVPISPPPYPQLLQPPDLSVAARSWPKCRRKATACLQRVSRRPCSLLK